MVLLVVEANVFLGGELGLLVDLMRLGVRLLFVDRLQEKEKEGGEETDARHDAVEGEGVSVLKHDGCEKRTDQLR